MGFKWDALSGEPSFDISLGDIQAPQTTLDEIFEYMIISSPHGWQRITKWMSILGSP